MNFFQINTFWQLYKFICIPVYIAKLSWFVFSFISKEKDLLASQLPVLNHLINGLMHINMPFMPILSIFSVSKNIIILLPLLHLFYSTNHFIYSYISQFIVV